MNLLKILLVFILLFIINCSTTENYLNNSRKNNIKNVGINNFLNIHNQPKKGDYSIQYIFSSNRKIKYLYAIIDISTNTYLVKRKINDSKPNHIECYLTFIPLIKFEEINFDFEYLVKDDGQIIDAYIIHPKAMERTKINLYNKDLNILNDTETYLIKTNIGEFNCNLIIENEINYPKGYYNIRFLSKKVNFRLVREYRLDYKNYIKFLALTKIEKENYKPEIYKEIFEQGNNNR